MTSGECLALPHIFEEKSSDEVSAYYKMLQVCEDGQKVLVSDLKICHLEEFSLRSPLGLDVQFSFPYA
ncbi:Hypothetical predicted protein [Octopus vulgaris]|uniref:Uncharacterized protein n=1 Tax=Octopus vulgaris TaxID=6645 RepID=A0AA36EYJ8_OCTVU|nr:Hypothetical predicted protein [Octopus vulgaris]